MTNRANSRRALLVSVQNDGEELRVVLDDVVSDHISSNAWKIKDHVTSKILNKKALLNAELSEKELADFGHYVFSRLSAFVQRNEN